MKRLEVLRDLERRLAEATGPDRELDVAIMAACFDWAQPGEPYYSPACQCDEPIYWHAPSDWLYKKPCPSLTASLDAAIALAERVLPGCARLGGKGQLSPDEPLYAWVVFYDMTGEKELAQSESNCEPIALCLAIVRALIAKEEGNA